MLEARLRKELRGEVYFDAFTRGRYSTDASIYQIRPLGVVVPRDDQDAICALDIAAEAGVPILPRGAGSSQCGQSVGEALVIDSTKFLDRVDALDVETRTVRVQPGLVLDRLNALLKPHGLWFPVDVSTAAQATIGGMTANNSCGARSLRYGNMVHNVAAVRAWLSNGRSFTFGPTAHRTADVDAGYAGLVDSVRALYRREREEIAARVPRVQRRVAGYNLDLASGDAFNMASLLVGSEGTLGWFRDVTLKLAPLPRHKALGVVQFPTFFSAMDMTRHIVALEPVAVELVDRTMIELSRKIPAFRATIEKVVRGEPDALLLVEFAGDDRGRQLEGLHRLTELMGDLGLPGSVVEVEDEALQREVWEVRKAGLNIMMSMKGDGKPVSFIEDCAVPLEHLAEYTDRLTRIFAKHGTRGTFYAHASVGCLHVRPVLNMKTEAGAKTMRAIAEEACAMVREYKGSYSGEHGDGLVRSEWIERVYGPRLGKAFAELKTAFDPKGLMNPGKIVAAPKMDERDLFRFKPGYATEPLATALDWSAHLLPDENPERGFAAAVEMCNNNGHCRKFDAGVMCPSFRATRDEQHSTRGRANSLRLALSGQLGRGAFSSQQLYATLDLCVSCKGCRRECPTGVDMARMKIEFLHHYHREHARSASDRLIAHLPRYASWGARFAPLLNAASSLPPVAKALEQSLGFTARRRLPRWNSRPFEPERELRFAAGNSAARKPREVVLFSDTFNRYFEPENLRAAVAVLTAAGYRVSAPSSPAGRPLCCGRTYLASGMVDKARAEAERLVNALAPHARAGAAIVGLEPSCVLGLRDEIPSLVPGPDGEAVAAAALLFNEFVFAEAADGGMDLPLRSAAPRRALVHGHCHQKAFGVMPSVVGTLRLVQDLTVSAIDSSCCGMAGAFGYAARHYEVSMKMGEAALLPAVRDADASTVIVADGTSCRQQVRDGAGREAVHTARLLAESLPPRAALHRTSPVP